MLPFPLSPPYPSPRHISPNTSSAFNTESECMGGFFFGGGHFVWFGLCFMCHHKFISLLSYLHNTPIKTHAPQSNREK